MTVNELIARLEELQNCGHGTDHVENGDGGAIEEVAIQNGTVVLF